MKLSAIWKKKKTEYETRQLAGLPLPRHIAFIMDGNGRWAKKRGLPRTAGHRAGVETLRRVIRFCGVAGIEAVTFYAFSTENWSRPKQEVDTLMNLVVEFFTSEIDELVAEGAVIRIIGSREGVPQKVLETIERAQERTKDNHGIFVNIAFNYGGREEIVHAARELAELCAQGKLCPEQIDEKLFADHLYTAGICDPDLVVRTSGEKRISNYLLYQSAYAEYEFPKIYWPEVDEEALVQMLREYAKRDRRFGGVKGEKTK